MCFVFLMMSISHVYSKYIYFFIHIIYLSEIPYTTNPRCGNPPPAKKTVVLAQRLGGFQKSFTSW